MSIAGDDRYLRLSQTGTGLSSAIFTLNVREAGQFISAVGSDCGIVSVNIATNTINYSTELPLVQGVSFDIE